VFTKISRLFALMKKYPWRTLGLALAFSLWAVFTFNLITATSGSRTIAQPNATAHATTGATTPIRGLGRPVELRIVPISYSQMVKEIAHTKVSVATFAPVKDQLIVDLANRTAFSTYYPPLNESQLANQLTADGANVSVTPTATSSGSSTLSYVLLVMFIIAFLIFILNFVHRRATGGASGGRSGAGAMANHTKMKGALSVIPNVHFADVAGCDEAVQEVGEMVDFLKDPARYQLMGAKMPAGIILYGPPGTGKTMLAKAVAGEAQVPFFACSGSEFVEMFVGVGAARVKSLFEQARKAAPAVLFIDEIDAVGKSRGNGINGNDERDSTLNQLLVELDGFSGREGLVVIAATNLLDTLDKALLRPGRLSRHVQVGLPSAEGRLKILQVHSQNKPLDVGVNLADLAQFTAGSSGAELAEMINEGAIMAARERSARISQQQLREGFLRVIAGPRKASATLAAGERETIAYHEAGHVLCGELCETIDKTIHATINPRGQAAGFAVTGRSDRALHGEQHIHEQLIHILGGRAAEAVINGTVSSGAANDLERANEIARTAVERLGLSPLLGQVVAHQRGLSQEMTADADREVRRLVDDAYQDAVALIRQHQTQLEAIAQSLLATGDIERDDIVAAMTGVRSKAWHPRQPMTVVAKNPVVSEAAGPMPAAAKPARVRGSHHRPSARARVRDSLVGELGGAIARSASETVAARRARKQSDHLAL
jgi:cell division protease FtsH